MSKLARTLVAGHCLLSVLANDALSVTVSDTTPLGASAYVDPSFAGFGIEPSNLFSFMGQEEPNKLTLNLVDNLVKLTGRPPHFRIGGNTADNFIYREDQDKWDWKKNPNPKGQGNFPTDEFIIGPHYFDAANRLPKGTPVTWGLSLAYMEDDYIEQITTTAQQVVDRCKNLNLVSFEIGNEPDLYGQNGFRTGAWDAKVYSEQWLDRAKAVWQQVLKPNNISSDFFETSCTASTIGTTFEIKDMSTYGITADAPGSSSSYIKSWNQHDYYYYIGVSTYALTMDHFTKLSTTEDQFEAWEEQIDQAHATGYPYALREMGVVGPIGMEGITNTFGAALWSLNFLLYAATLNITSVQFHMTDNSNASAWQPVERYGRQPFVRPLYYSYAAFDQVIGPTCNAQVYHVEPKNYPGGYEGYVKVYSVYQAGQLASVVAINSKPANVSVTDKPSLDIKVSLPKSLSGKQMHLARLTSEGADATDKTVWNGISYEENNDGLPSQAHDDDEITSVGSDGTLTISVRNSEAVVANLNNKVGKGLKADARACAAFVEQSPGVGTSVGPEGAGGGGDEEDKNAGAGISTRGGLVVALVSFVAGTLMLF
ncbi:Beta-glucuronidase [Apiospora phragmitis]|uniref:Beta-glucuronidase n=1 Tax=Apiospora phragmitis TaxID=2905665 RepID=A0ABR1T2G9_9PEZI